MFNKLLVFLAIGVLVPTYHCLHTFRINKLDHHNYIEESDLEDNKQDLKASSERDLIDIRPEEAFDNDIADVDSTFEKEKSFKDFGVDFVTEKTDTNIVEDDLEPETDDKVVKDTEWDESQSEEDDVITMSKPTESTDIEDVAIVDDPIFLFKLNFPENDLDGVDNKSDEEDSIFHFSFSVNDDDIKKIDEKSEVGSKGVIIPTELGVDHEIFAAGNDLDAVEKNDDGYHFFSFKISFNNDEVLVDDTDTVDNENKEERNFGIFGTVFGDNVEILEEVQPDITIITPAEDELKIEEDVQYDLENQKALELAAAMDAYLKEQTTTEKIPLVIYDYFNRKYIPYDYDYESEFFNEKAGYSDNSGYFGNFLEPTSSLQVQSNPFQDRHWHVSPVYRPYALRYEKKYE